MNGEFDLITLIALIVAAAAVFKLRSVLGQRSEDDDQRVERLRSRERQAQAANESGSADVITLPRRDREGAPATAEATADAQMGAMGAEQRVRAYAAIDTSVTDGMLAIAKLDNGFDPDAFLVGAGRAYEMIVSAFAEGNRKGLKDLLGREVYDGFAAAIGEREARGETVEQQFVGIKKMDIVEAEMKSGVAYLTVRFVSELITAVRDKAGAVVSGDPQKIKDVTDIWTYSRDVSTARARTNLNWRLVGTQAPN